MSRVNPLVGFPCIGRVEYFHCASANLVKEHAGDWAKFISRGVQGGCLAFGSIRDHRNWLRAGKPFTAPEPLRELPPYYHKRIAFEHTWQGLKSKYPWVQYKVKVPYFDGWMGFEWEGDIAMWKSEGFPMVRVKYEL